MSDFKRTPIEKELLAAREWVIDTDKYPQAMESFEGIVEALKFTLHDLSEQNEKLKKENKFLKLQQYKWNCSGCGHFDKYLSRTCPSCGRQNYYSGSFKREDLEKWFDEQGEE